MRRHSSYEKSSKDGHASKHEFVHKSMDKETHEMPAKQSAKEPAKQEPERLEETALQPQPMPAGGPINIPDRSPIGPSIRHRAR